MAAKKTDIDFPVGDDPDDINVLRYWEEVVKRLRLAILPRDLVDWADAIQDRIDTWYTSQTALHDAMSQLGEIPIFDELLSDADRARIRAQDELVIQCQRACRDAKFEFARLKWKLSQHFGRQFDLDSPAIRALFAPREDGLQN